MYTLISDSIVIWALLLIVIAAVVMQLQSKRNKRMDRAIAFLETGQYEPANQSTVDGLIDYARGLGKESLALTLVRTVREAYGHSGLKNAHIFWCGQVLDGKVPYLPGDPIPAFEKTL